jgi:hypothetical protein
VAGQELRVKTGERGTVRAKGTVREKDRGMEEVV